eukprot:gnl/TRDRNA2_/TRDRNA2_165441_c0_seq2.p1 gnl/TRDRNA2_/TRDRNA2_165441_c0~~gnl/TRDRNA2_/TRDRNA2_165441_c0_seq2.p1  ORF type:complete len:380 (-),score=51.35 gnl/TRDRNA2_/TRDRNA2_165441_c0_seq2:55-1050(-)
MRDKLDDPSPPDEIFELWEDAPSVELFRALKSSLPAHLSPGGADAGAARTISRIVARIECAKWGYNETLVDKDADAALVLDDAMLRDAAMGVDGKPLGDMEKLLVRLRLSRRKLLRTLKCAMEDAADAADKDPKGGVPALLELVNKDPEALFPSVYKEFVALPPDQLDRWKTMTWDWKYHGWIYRSTSASRSRVQARAHCGSCAGGLQGGDRGYHSGAAMANLQSPMAWGGSRRVPAYSYSPSSTFQVATLRLPQAVELSRHVPRPWRLSAPRSCQPRSQRCSGVLLQLKPDVTSIPAAALICILLGGFAFGVVRFGGSSAERGTEQLLAK